MRARLFLLLAVTAVLPLIVAGCGAVGPAVQPPDEYLNNALDWIESHSIIASQVDFAAAPTEALALNLIPKSTAETHAAIRHVLAATRDSLAWLYSPADPAYRDPGLAVTYPELVVNEITPGGPAERAGVHAGDRVLAVNGAVPRPLGDNPAFYAVDFGRERQVRLTLQREGQAEPVEVTFDRVENKGFDYQGVPDGRTPVAGIRWGSERGRLK